MFSIIYMYVSLITTLLLSSHLCIQYVKAILAAWSMRLNFIWGIRYQILSVSASIIASSSLFPRGHSPCVLWGSRSWWTSYGTAGTLPWAGWGCVSAYVCWASSSSWMTGHTPTKHRSSTATFNASEHTLFIQPLILFTKFLCSL